MRIGVTQRITYDPSYGERRDALATDWHRFLTSTWHDAVVVPVPNAPRHLERFVDALAIEAFVLTGGNDLGTEPERDQTEAGCLAHAARHGLPVIGVCRGFQMMVAHSGGRVIPTDRQAHVATRHPVEYLTDTPWGWSEGHRAEVNSFHGFAIPAGGLPDGWIPLAVSDDRGIEAARSVDGRWTAVMWHPEREQVPAPGDIALFRYGIAGGRTR